MPSPAELLESLGYSIQFRATAWVDCLLLREQERTVGHGRTESDALADAIRKLLPSHAARVLFERALAMSRSPAAPTDVARRADVAPQAGAAPQAKLERSVDTEKHDANPTHADDAKSAAKPIAVASASIVAPSVEIAKAVDGGKPIVVESASNVASATEIANAVDGARPLASLPSLDHAADLERLSAELDATIEDLGMLSTKRQRLAILRFLARARAIQEMTPTPEARGQVTHIARTLSACAGRWWPGSILALRLDATPADVAKSIEVDSTSATWASIAVFAEAGLAEAIREGALRGLDADGWADASRLDPSPKDPARLLDDVTTAIEAYAGPLSASPRRSEKQPGSGSILQWAHALRWLRSTVPDRETWAAAMGRLRYFTSAKNARPSPEALAAIDPEIDPGRPWASFFESVAKQPDPAFTATRERDVESLFGAAPPHGDRQALIRWLAMALPLADTHHEPIARALVPFASVVASFSAEDFPGMGRRIYRRLAHLQRELAPATEASSSDAAREESMVTTEVVDKTRGRRAVYVSNRSDPELQARLLEAFAFETLDWADGDPNKVDALIDTLMQEEFDLVVGANGFLANEVDEAITIAGNTRGVPYVRANRGKLADCARAFAKDL
ncbi:hypothetical protein BH09MYX1_BH09MYX1_07190 [soil metagenome]